MNIIQDLADYLEQIAPLDLQESYDNSGLIIGNTNWIIKNVLVALDVTEPVIDEAIELGCNVIVSHHPLIFKGLKRISDQNHLDRGLIKAIKNDIAIYAIHTNYDNVLHGVNAMIAEKIGLENCSILDPKRKMLKKLYTFIPVAHYDKVSKAVFEAGAGHIGNYSETGFSSAGTGSFKGNEASNPAYGKKGMLEKVEEIKFETIFPANIERKVISALLKAHPYEEVAFDILSLDNAYSKVGSGMVGSLKKPMEEMAFLKMLKKVLGTGAVRYTPLRGKPVQKVAICGGAGRFLLNNAIAAGADVFVSADFKYHDFFDADNKIVVADVGHYESEQFTRDLLAKEIRQKFPIIAALISKVNTNPIKYL